MAPSRDQITKAVMSLVYAETWTESKRDIESYRDLLLTEAADAVLVDLLMQYRDDEGTTRHLEELRTLLARCRHEGIEAAFDDYLRPTVAPLESDPDNSLEDIGEVLGVSPDQPG